MEARRYLRSVGADVKELFVENRMLLSFEEWADDFLQDPLRQSRSSAQFLRDAIDSFGSRPVATPGGPKRRFKLFDMEQDEGIGAVHGQEEAQNAIYRILGNFAQVGRADKLILLHGPNGSAKSSLVGALARGLEIYSRSPEGALYRINWIFPGEKLVKGAIGFGERGLHGELATYAHLGAEATDARITCEMKDHPIFLIPRKERKKILADAARRRGGGSFVLPQSILDGELCHKCRHIYAGLMSSYGGDYLQVLRHVQVERFYISRRYLVGAVKLEPQMSVDASFFQLTADRSAGQLPAAFQNLDLFAPFGPLVYANRGILEYSDLLKRPMESFKYLLDTTETGVLRMEHFLLHLDEVLIATSNEKHLAAFKETSDFASFKGRIELVQVPYLRQVSIERQIYDHKVTRAAVGGKHIAPHATEIAANWAVLTRLRRPDPDRYEPELRDLVDGLSPMEKLRLYDEGRAPERLTTAESRLLRANVESVYSETASSPAYEGRFGASAREIQTVLLNAGQDPSYPCLSPLAVLEEIRRLCKDKSVYEFLQLPKRDGYQDPEGFVDLVEAEYLDAVDDEVRASMGLITEAQYHAIFERYLVLVSHWVKGEKIANRVTGEKESPDEGRMREIEEAIRPQGEDRATFRRGLIASVGAWRLDHPSEGSVDYEKVFPQHFRRLRDHFFEDLQQTLRRTKVNVLAYLSREERDSLGERERRAVEETLERMRAEFGYCEHCAKEAIALLLSRRYA